MKEYLVIRLIDRLDKNLYWFVVRNTGAKPLLHGTCNIQNISSELSHLAKNRVVVVLVPGEQVLLTTVAIPAQQKRYVANVVPYLLEEQLCNDVEKSHFIVNPVIYPDKDISVSIVSREQMDQWLACFKDSGVRITYLIPETLAIPYDNNQWCVNVDRAKVTVRYDQHLGFSCDMENFIFFMSTLLSKYQNNTPGKIRVYSDSVDIINKLTLITGDIEIEHHDNSLAGHEYIFDQDLSGINLLQEDYQQSSDTSSLWRKGQIVAALTAACLVLYLTINLVTIWKLNAEIERLKNQTHVVFKNTFPEKKRIVNPEVQMQNELIKLDGEAGNHHEFLSLLYKIGPALDKSKETRPMHMSYERKKNELRMQLRSNNFQSLDKFKELTESTGVNVELSTVTDQGDYFIGHMIIRDK